MIAGTRASWLLSALLAGALSAEGADSEIRFLSDEGHIAVIEHDGSRYDKLDLEGNVNAGPRQRIARELIATHGDFYDFIVVFTNFEFERGDAIGFYMPVRNDVSGIGLPVGDSGDDFGSPKRLQGFIDMGPVSQYREGSFSVEPTEPGFRAALGVLAHEIGHRWLVGARFASGGLIRNDLLGKDDAHWSFLLSSDASFLYGNDWESIGGNRYRSVEVQSRFSELDLYLMGFLAPEEVSPMTLLVNPEIDRARLPELSAEVEATSVETVTIEQILAAEGPRVPSHRESQKDFTIAFVFLTGPSLLPTEDDLEVVDRFRSNFVDTFFSLTRGRALADPDLQHVTPETPGAEPDAFLALAWLLTQQQADGRFEAHPLTAVRDTASALLALGTMGVRGAPADRARAYLSHQALQNPASVDLLARAISAGVSMDRMRLELLRNPDGGYGIAAGYRSDPLDTAVALQALSAEGGAPEGLAEALVSMQLPDGSWSSISGQPGDVMTTSEAALALQLVSDHEASVQAALGWLVERQQPNGGFGDGPATPYATALVLDALLNGSSPPASVERAVSYLRETQSADGSWNQSVFDTSAVLRSLVPSTFANLAVAPSDVRLEPDPPEVSETVRIEVTVRNRSRIAAGTFDVQLFDGDPEAGGIAIGSPVVIAGLGAGGSASASFSWDTTGLEGPHTLFAIADFASALSEVSKDDNFAALDVEVLPPLPNLVPVLSALPARPIEGVLATLTARIENRGSFASAGASVRFYRETPRLGILLGEAAAPPLAPGASAEVSVSWDTSGHLGSHRIYVVVDPVNDVRERIETDNEASLAIDVRTPPPAQPDLQIDRFVLTPGEIQTLPLNVVASARIANTGLDPVPSALVEIFLGNPAEGGVLLASRSLPVPGDSFIDVTFDLTVETGGTRSYFLRLDARPTSERDLTNNLASAVLRDRMDTVEVTLVPGSIVLSSPSLDPGEVLEVDVTARNKGTRPLSSVAIGLLYEVAPGAGFRSASVVNLPLAPGGSAVARLTWKANRSGVVPLEIRIDPANVLAEGNENDNLLSTSVEVTPSTLPNLTLSSSDIAASPLPLVEGAPAVVEARVRNLGDGAAGPFAVRFFAAGVEIDVVTVMGLSPQSEALVSVSWDSAHGRGDTAVFVEVDSASAVEELDEADNSVFRVFDIVGLPDLLATSAQVVLSPPFARSGETIGIEASFGNAGEQPAAPFRAELRLDDPVAGALIASGDFDGLGPGETQTLSASWDTTGIEGEHSLYLVIDAGAGVRESREDNNVARVAVALQDADFFVTPIYFSPDGDGVQDETALFYRVSGGSLAVEVRDIEESLVRELPAPGGNGSAVWDGRNARGIVAPDGEYSLVLLADGAEVLRRRVVLDTNRSRIVDALGSDLVTATQLTCPLPANFSGLEGPAWLPDDSAAYVIVQFADPVNAPDFPVGLYRISRDGRSIELIRADESFSAITFIDGVDNFSVQPLRAVAADGARALVRSFSDGIQVLDLVNGERTALGHDFTATAAWTSNGRRIVIASSTGVFLHDRDGNPLSTVVQAGAELALPTPDDLRIVYRRLDEVVLRVVNLDGSGDRRLESTSAAPHFEFELFPENLVVVPFYFLGRQGGFVFGWFANGQEQGAGPFRVDADGEGLEAFEQPGELSSDQRFELTSAGSFHVARRFGGRESRPIVPSNFNFNLHWSYRDVVITYEGPAADGCVGPGIWALRSLLNGEADLRLTRLPSRFGIRIAGTASDQNLDAFHLEFAPAANPEAFSPVQPPSAAPVVAETFTTWIPPAPGDYLVRLRVTDKAGNETRRLDRIFWEESPPISSLRRTPSYLSPNGDGVQDELRVEYDVLTPVNPVFRVRDQAGRVVRSIPRDELTPGPASFVWDGTSDLGLPLEDGRYVLEIEGAELPIVLDATEPVVAARYSELYTDGEERNELRLAVDIEGTIRDQDLDRWELATSTGEVITSSQREVDDGLIVESARPVQGLEIRAFDRAGNRTVVPLTGPTREVRVVRAAGKEVGPLSPGPAEPVGPQFVRPGSAIGFQAGTSFASTESGLTFRYRGEGESSFTGVPTSSEVTLRADDLVLGRRYSGHFESDGFASQEVIFTVGPEAIFLTGTPILSVPPKVLVSFTSTITEPVVEARLLRTSGGLNDVVQLFRPLPERGSVTDLHPSCGITVGYRIEAKGASGTIYRSTTALSYPRPVTVPIQGSECLSVDDAAVESQARPDDSIPSAASAIVNRNASSGPAELALLLDGVEVGRVVAEGDALVPFDVSAVPEGNHELSVAGGDFGLSFFLDQSQPFASIVSPAEGGNACVATENGRDFVELDVLARDRQIEGLQVELRGPDGSFGAVAILDPIQFPVPNELNRRIRVLVPEGLSGSATFRLVASSPRILGELAGRKSPVTPPLWPRKENNGVLLGSAVRNLVLARSLGLGPLAAAPKLFSPNEDGFVDEVRVLGEAREAVALTVRVFTVGPPRQIVRTVVTGEPGGEGPFEIVWDGKDDGGFFVPDGKYEIEVEAVNGCGGASTGTVEVETDTTPPTVEIEESLDSQPISIGVEVVGTARDLHFDHYLLEFGEGLAPLSFLPVGPPMLHQVIERTLANWSVGELAPGPYTLRLSARDVVGNQDSTRVSVQVVAADFIALHRAEPALFSPNGDTRLDSTELRFELEAEARVTLQIRNANETIVATLLDGAVLPAGPHIRIWDGQGTADGEYVVFLRAEHPLTPSLFEESRVSVAIDTVVPSLDLSSPEGDGFLSLPAGVSGRIEDRNLERYRIEAGPVAGPLSELATDSLPIVGIITTLRGLGDGDYRLRARASDLAGNASEVDFIFHVDSTRPRLSLTAPLPSSFLSRPPDSVSVHGTIEEANLLQYDLEVGFGDPPSVFAPLARGTSGPVDFAWGLDALPDGPYTLRLTAIDRAGNFAQVAAEVTLDATPPAVAIESPSPGTVASEAISVRGSLTDRNFAEGSLHLAPAAHPAQLTQIASFSAPVGSGILKDGLALEGGDYLLELRARDRAGNLATATTAFSVDAEPPLPPSDLTASSKRQDVTLAWSASPSSDVFGYHVSRDGIRITTAPVPTTSFVDRGLSEGRFRYVVVAVDRAGLESEPTDPAAATVDLTPPNVVLRSPDEGERVRVQVDVLGTAFAENDFLEYRLSVASAETPSSPTLLARSSVPVTFATLAQWQALVDGDYILTLEAEDTSGNSASDDVRVTVDNQSPAAPSLLRADADADDVEIEWRASGDADVEGYLVFRNGRIANAPGPVSGSLKPFLVSGPIYLDAGPPDGRHCYRVAAMDLAGNLSHDSNEICVFLDNRAPKVIFFDPEDGARFDSPRLLRAQSDDLDIATVAFEFQREGDLLWTAIGIDGEAPFEILWDIAGLAFGPYRLRAIATDVGTRSDPDPATIRVELADVTPPAVPAGLTARTRGSEVLLSWEAVTDSDLEAYRIYRGDTLVRELPAAVTSASDVGVVDGFHEYRVTALDVEGNESARSGPAPARVGAPVLLPSYPVFDTHVVDLPGENAEPGATVRLLPSDASTVADAEGRFTFEALVLPMGANLLEAEATDARGNVSRRSAEILLVRNERPAEPSGFGAVANGDEAELSWDPNGELDLSGYLVTRDSEILNPRGLLRPAGAIPTGMTAHASTNEAQAPGVIDRASGFWSMSANEEQWIELRLATPRHVEEIRLLWAFQRAPSDYDLLIELEGRLAPVARIRGNTELAVTTHVLPIPVRTARVRLQIFSNRLAVFLGEFELYGVLPEPGTAFTETPPRSGFYDYAVSALDVLGGRSDDAGPVRIGVGDVTPPDPPVNLVATANGANGVDVSLMWTASAAPDVERYRVFRDGVAIFESLTTTHVDVGLRNGTFTYHVVAVDGAGNESPPSNLASATVDVAPPSAPVLALSVVPAGKALSLSWTEAFGPLAVVEYALSRASSSGGPFAEIARVGTLSFVDRGLVNGAELFYVVRAIDVRGEPSPSSNEVRGVPEDSGPPPPPVILAPTTTGFPRTVASSGATLIGASEPSSLVEAFREGIPLGSVETSSAFRDVVEPFLGTSGNVSGRVALSSDRNTVAELVFDSEARLYDLATGDVRSVPYHGAFSFEQGLSFSPSGRKLAVATTAGADVNRAIRILDLETEATEVLPMSGAPQSPAWISEEELAVVVSSDVRVIDVETRAERTLRTTPGGFIPQRLVASADGAFLAWGERSEELYVLPSSGGTPALVVDDLNLDRFVWAGAKTLAFTVFDSGLRFYDAESGLVTAVPGTEGMTDLASLGAEGAVSTLRGRTLFWVLPDGTVRELEEIAARYDRELFGWSSALHLAGTTNELSLLVVETPGRFELEVKLAPGTNLLTARATDASGNESPHSGAIELSFENDALPDLIFDRAIEIVPSAPVSGETASVSVSVRNQGVGPSEPTVISLSGVDLGGNLYAIGTRAVPGLAPGASSALSLLWPTTGRIGPQTLVATIDPLALLDESNEENNAASAPATIVGAEGLELSISLGRGSYRAGETAEITVSVVNGGAARSFTLETVIEDARGARVAVVDSRTTSLGYAGATRYSVFWPTGSILAGSYVARVRALDATAAAPFTLTRTLTVALDATAERPVYRAGDAVTLLARVTHTGGNAPIPSLSLRYRVLDPGQNALFETVAPLGYLAIGGSTSSQAIWPSGAVAPGFYRLIVEAFEALNGGELLASTEASFEMRPLSSATLSGRLSLARSAVPSGEDVVARYTIENESVIGIANGVVRVEIVDPAERRTVASAEASVSIEASPSGSSATGELRIATSGLALGSYTVVLSAGEASLDPLASAPLVVFATPSAPSLNAPPMGGSAPQRLALSVNNASNPNGEILLYEFELYLDPSLELRIAAASSLPEGTNTTTWLLPMALEENRSYFWRARAADRFATSDWMSPAEVFVDSQNDAPEAPILSEPFEASDVGVLRPALVVVNALDFENDVLTYSFELYRDAELTDRLAEVSGVAAGSATTAFTFGFDLVEDGEYFWRARANDGVLDSEWMSAASFRVNTGNQAPEAPELLAPKSGKVPTLTPELVARAARDPEGDPVTHVVQIDTTDRFDSAALQESPELAASGNEVRFPPPLPLEENGVYFWRARASDGLAISSWSEIASFRADAVNEAPSAPTPQRPLGGSVVESTTPSLAVVNAADPERDRLSYTFEVYEDQALTTLAARVTELAEGVSETAWVASPRLSDGKTYYWRAFAHDGNIAGAPSRVESFRVGIGNGEPSAPALVSPANGAIVSDPAPTLVVRNATDPDSDPLTYTFEVYEDELLTLRVEASGDVPEGIGETSFTMSADLRENHLYFWRVRAFDGAVFGSWMETARFRFSLENERPASPVPIEPSDGAVLDLAQPTLIVSNATDPENDALRYRFEVFRDPALTDLVASSPQIDEGAARTSWLVSPALAENGAFYWRATAFDGALASPPSAVFRFTVDAVEEPPTVPVLASPADGATIESTSPPLVVENATSPDGARAEPLRYHFALYADEALLDLLVEDPAVPEGNLSPAAGRTAWEVPMTLSPGATYFWRVRAIDSRGLASDWARSFRFTVEPPQTDCPPEWREDFERHAVGTTPAGWQLVPELGNPRFLVEKKGHSRRLASAATGQGSLVFAGNGEAFDWRNYELEGELRQSPLRDDEGCVFKAGVAFYARPEDGVSYRLEITGPKCKAPKARIVKVEGASVRTLRSIELDDDDELRFQIETVNHPGSTSIRARLEVDDDHFLIEVEDTQAPLRSGTVGAWASSIQASWDELRVREVQGFESGISGDADGDGVCDVAEDECEAAIEICLDEGYNAATGLSPAVVARLGDTRHDGPTACGAHQSYSVKRRTGVLVVRTPALAGDTYRFSALIRRGSDGKIELELPDGTYFEISSHSDHDDGDDDDDDDDAFVWSKPIEVALPPGAHDLRLRSRSNATVHVEGYRLESCCS